MQQQTTSKRCDATSTGRSILTALQVPIYKYIGTLVFVRSNRPTFVRPTSLVPCQIHFYSDLHTMISFSLRAYPTASKLLVGFLTVSWNPLNLFSRQCRWVWLVEKTELPGLPKSVRLGKGMQRACSRAAQEKILVGRWKRHVIWEQWLLSDRSVYERSRGWKWKPTQ